MWSNDLNWVEAPTKVEHAAEVGLAIARGRDSGQRSSSMIGLSEIIGEEATAKLIRGFGGARVYVPRLPEEGDALTSLIGTAAAQKLAQIYGGERLELPKPNARRSQILELRRSGVSVDLIARQIGCTRRRVFQVLAEARMTPQQAARPGAQHSHPAGVHQSDE